MTEYVVVLHVETGSALSLSQTEAIDVCVEKTERLAHSTAEAITGVVGRREPVNVRVDGEWRSYPSWRVRYVSVRVSEK